MSSIALLTSHRFRGIFACIALGAFNDNFYKNALIILTTYSLAAKLVMDAGMLISLASACFILPFFLFSGIAGELADQMEKHRLVRMLKVTELLLVLVAILALFYEHAWGLMVILFLLGMQAAFFGPTKYAILPELLERDELLLGNGIVESGTFCSILLGTLLGGLLILQPGGIAMVSAILLVASVLGLFAAWRVPATPAMHAHARVHLNFLGSTWRMVRIAFSRPGLVAPILGISWFWAIGATYLTQLPIFTKDVLGANQMVVTLFNGLFTVGIAAGSFACPFIRARFRSRHLSPLALVGIFLFGLDVCWIGLTAKSPTQDALTGLLPYLTASFDHVRIAVDLFLLAFCGGVFIVPLYTALQTQSAEAERARTIASNNVINSLFVAVGSIIATLMFAQHFTVMDVLLLFTLLNLPVIGLLLRQTRIRKNGMHAK